MHNFFSHAKKLFFFKKMGFENTLKKKNLTEYFLNLQDNYYEEIDIEDFYFDEKTKLFTYPCPCGDDFSIFLDDLIDGEEVARCPSCTLFVRIIYNADDLNKFI